MAAVDGLPPDPLALLRRSIAEQHLPVPSSNPDPTTQAESDTPFAEASYLVFNFQSPQDGGEHVSIPLNQLTRFESASQNRALELRSVYFCWLNKDAGGIEYINAVSELNIQLKASGKQDEVATNLVFAEKLDLVSWLGGDVGENESEYIRSLDDNKLSRREADDAAAAARGGEDVEMRDAGLSDAAARKREAERLREIYSGERKMGDRNTCLRGVKIQDFSGVRKYSALFLGKSASRPQQQQQAASTPALTSNPALRPPIKPPQPGRRPEPIILLSPSASSLLRMPNIKSFLVDGVYTPPEAGSTGTNILHLTRTLPSISSHALRFILVDSPDQFKPSYWDRVVAVFTTGQTWQFKNYRWQNPAELFAHALGVYVGWRGEVVPDTVKGWGRGVLTVQIDKGVQRWRDREVVEDVWSALERRMKAMGWGAAGK